MGPISKTDISGNRETDILAQIEALRGKGISKNVFAINEHRDKKFVRKALELIVRLGLLDEPTIKHVHRSQI